MREFWIALILLVATRVGAQEPTELYDCVDDADGPGFCTGDSTVVLVDEGCGATFNRYHGRIAWPVLRNVGPVTISVKTRYVRFSTTQLPLYIEVRGHIEPVEPIDCTTGLSGHLILVSQGGPECDGAWESVGPISLVPFGVPLGALYTVQAVFFEALPDDHGEIPFHSIGFSCIRVTSHPSPIALTTWSRVKVLFR